MRRIHPLLALLAPLALVLAACVQGPGATPSPVAPSAPAAAPASAVPASMAPAPSAAAPSPASSGGKGDY